MVLPDDVPVMDLDGSIMNEDDNNNKEDEEENELEVSMLMMDTTICDGNDAIVAATMNVSEDLSTEDALQILQSKSLLRKNLDQEEFQQQHQQQHNNNLYGTTNPSPLPVALLNGAGGVPEKVAHFESETKKNILAAAAASTSTATRASTCNISSIAAATTLPTSMTSTTLPPALPRFQVILRVRPSTDKESNTIHILSDTTVQTHPPPSSYTGTSKEYAFDKVLSPTLSQQQVYEQTAAPLVSRIFQGGSVLLFCYGVTNAGKTYTVHGGVDNMSRTNITSAADNNSAPDASWGILPRILYDTLQRVKTTTPDKEVHMTFFELYQEHFYDLLPDDSANAAAIPSNPLLRKALRLREDKLNGHAFVEGLATHKVTSMAQALQWMKAAKKNRVTSTNHLNQHSSRSHFVCQITVSDSSEPVAAASSSTTTMTSSSSSPPATFWVVDLAGSERSKRTASAGAMRHQEACSINKSLMVLMRCLMTLKEPSSHNSNNNSNSNTSSNNSQPFKFPPYRESKMTRLLMPHWTDASNTVTSMIVNVNPAASDYDESQHVLGYATQAKSIQLPISTSAATSAATAKPIVQYDANGRRVKAGGGTGTLKSGVCAKVGKLLQKISPKRAVNGLKRKQHTTDDSLSLLSKKPSAVAAPNAATSNKRHKTSSSAASTATSLQSSVTKPPPPPPSLAVPPGTANVKASKAYKALKMELTVAKTEIDILTGEKQGLVAQVEALEDQLENLEFQVRSEVVQELSVKMDEQRLKYEGLISSLRQQNATASAMKQSTTPFRLVDTRRLEDLEDQVKEYEDDILQLRENMASLEHEYQRRLDESHQESNRLRTELAKKQELVNNYSRLLREDDDDVEGDDVIVDEEMNNDVDQEEEEEEEEESEDDTLDAGKLHGLYHHHRSEKDRPSTESGMGSESEEEESEDDRRATLISKRRLTIVSKALPASGGTETEEEEVEEDDDDDRRATLVSKPRIATADTMEAAELNRGSATSMDRDDTNRFSLALFGQAEAPAPADEPTTVGGNENGASIVSSGVFSPKQPTQKSTKSGTPASDRKPFGQLEEHHLNDSSRDGGDGHVENWVAPKIKAKIDPKTGQYKRPKGRMPSGVDSWDSTKGMWRCSLA